MEIITLVLVALLALVCGVVIGRLLLRSRLAVAEHAAETAAKDREALTAERDRRVLLEGSLSQMDHLREQLEAAHADLDELRERLEAATDARARAETEAKNVPILKDTLAQADLTIQRLRDESRNLNVELTESQTALSKDREAFEEKLGILSDAKIELQKVFENTASKLLEEKSDRFAKLNDANMEKLLRPLGEDLQNFRKKIDDVYLKESNQRFSLEKEIQRLVEQSAKISTEAETLAKALTTNVKVQGDWGEDVLLRILETCGLKEGVQFTKQEYLRGADGKPLRSDDGHQMRTDVILYYPDGRKVIVDSKMVLTDYNNYINAQTDDERKLASAAVLTSIRNHINGLSGKRYQDYTEALDFVILFVPVESAFALILQLDPGIWHYAFDKRILLSSPTNLVVAMKLISDLWRRDAQAKNYQEIVDRGGQLYDKFELLIQSIQDLGDHLAKAESAYRTTINRASEGRGNLLTQVEELKKLGVNTKKSLPSPAQLERKLESLTLESKGASKDILEIEDRNQDGDPTKPSDPSGQMRF